MYMSFQNKSFWDSLHLKNGLEDWDMAEELKLTVTTEGFPQGKGLRGIDGFGFPLNRFPSLKLR